MEEILVCTTHYADSTNISIRVFSSIRIWLQKKHRDETFRPVHGDLIEFSVEPRWCNRPLMFHICAFLQADSNLQDGLAVSHWKHTSGLVLGLVQKIRHVTHRSHLQVQKVRNLASISTSAAFDALWYDLQLRCSWVHDEVFRFLGQKVTRTDRL